jgi:YHS domain-containing protein
MLEAPGSGVSGPALPGRNGGVEEVDMAVDPVCNMKVDEKKAAATSEYKGKKYYFCARGCKTAFDQNPEKYLGKK